MVALPEREGLVGLAGLVVGFVAFTFGALASALGRWGADALALLVGGGLLGFAAAGGLVVYYHVVGVVGR